MIETNWGRHGRDSPRFKSDNVRRVAGCKLEVQYKGGVGADSMSSLTITAGERCGSLGVGSDKTKRRYRVMK